MYLPARNHPCTLAPDPQAAGWIAMEEQAKAGPGKKREKNDDFVPEEGTNEYLLYAVAENADREAFIQLFEYFAPRIKSFLMKSGITPEQADELAQETMLSVWDKARQYNPELASASTWIFTIARNKRIDLVRKLARPEPDPNDPALVNDSMPKPDEMLDRKTEAAAMAKAIGDLPEEQADMIRKSYFEEKTHDTIARETRLPLGTVKSRIRLALERLRQNEDIQSLWPQGTQKKQ